MISRLDELISFCAIFGMPTKMIGSKITRVTTMKTRQSFAD
jgi:hypothetical protein